MAMSEVTETSTPTTDASAADTSASEVSTKGKRAVVIVGAASSVPKKDFDLAIVAEGRVFEKNDAGDIVGSSAVESGYPKGADAYVRISPEAVFPDAKTIKTLGSNVQQGDFWGFSAQEGFLCVGPAHPAYAAANLAWQMGASSIEIRGLTVEEKAQLQPFFDAISTHPVAPAQVTVSFT